MTNNDALIRSITSYTDVYNLPDVSAYDVVSGLLHIALGGAVSVDQPESYTRLEVGVASLISTLTRVDLRSDDWADTLRDVRADMGDADDDLYND